MSKKKLNKTTRKEGGGGFNFLSFRFGVDPIISYLKVH